MSSLRYALMGKFATPELHAILKRAILQVAPAVTRARLHAILGIDVSNTFAALDLPILYLRATHDRVVARHCSELAAKLNPRTQIVDVAGPHWLLLSTPKDAADVVRSFLQTCILEG
jgi:sigma-B regulation protein RsbQ